MQSVVESVNMEEPQIGGLTVGYMKLTAPPRPPRPPTPLRVRLVLPDISL